jgi:hypothetical protein
MVWLVVARAHCETAAIFGVPAERKLDEVVTGFAVEECKCMVTGAHDEVDAAFEFVEDALLRIELMAALEEGAIALEDGEDGAGGLVTKRLVSSQNGPHEFGGGRREGARHSGGAIGLGNRGMAGST